MPQPQAQPKATPGARPDASTVATQRARAGDIPPKLPNPARPALPLWTPAGQGCIVRSVRAIEGAPAPGTPLQHPRIDSKPMEQKFVTRREAIARRSEEQ